VISSAVGTRRSTGERLVYARSTGGHRQSYVDRLGAMFGLQPVAGRIDRRLFKRLVAADILLIATLDDHLMSFAAVASARSMRRRPTTALFLRAQKCFEHGRWYYGAKRRAFRTLKRLPRLTVASITPFAVAPRHAEVAHAGVYDPQYWDLHDGSKLRNPPRTALADEVAERAAGRHVICALGTLSLDKGIAFLADTIVQNPAVASKLLVVAAGNVPSDAASGISKISGAGALVVDRFVSDDELESLYGVSDSIWTCYEPRYDQSSGIFGRAIQTGVRPVVRAGSISEAFAKAHGLDHAAASYGNCSELAELLMNSPEAWRSSRLSDPNRTTLVGGWRDHFIETIEAGLGLSDAPQGAR